MRVLKWFAWGLLALIVVLAISFVILLAPKDQNTTAKQLIEIKSDTSRADVAHQLTESGLIKSSFAFFLYLRLTQVKILAGPYELSANQSATDIASIIAEGKFKTARITLLEGWRATDIEEYLVTDKTLPQFKGFAASASQYEGYLFPDTYEIKVNATIPELVEILRQNYLTRTKDLTLTPDVVILASIVEREAKDDAERSEVAGVYANRLKIGMKLEADPTIQYAKGNWKAVTLDEYRSVISPYNTYLNAGLPPGPICNPGLKSLEAAVKPATHDYYFFFHAKGETYFSKTLTEHRAKINQYF